MASGATVQFIHVRALCRGHVDQLLEDFCTGLAGSGSTRGHREATLQVEIAAIGLCLFELAQHLGAGFRARGVIRMKREPLFAGSGMPQRAGLCSRRNEVDCDV